VVVVWWFGASCVVGAWSLFGARVLQNCAKDQELAQNRGYCCHQHAKVAKTEHEKYKKQVTRQKEKTKGVVVDEPEQCLHCAEDPCVFNQIEMRLCENDEIY
jgi:hypothetical protein